jgi:hypothetical protein
LTARLRHCYGGVTGLLGGLAQSTLEQANFSGRSCSQERYQAGKEFALKLAPHYGAKLARFLAQIAVRYDRLIDRLILRSQIENVPCGRISLARIRANPPLNEAAMAIAFSVFATSLQTFSSLWTPASSELISSDGSAVFFGIDRSCP